MNTEQSKRPNQSPIDIECWLFFIKLQFDLQLLLERRPGKFNGISFCGIIVTSLTTSSSYWASSCLANSELTLINFYLWSRRTKSRRRNFLVIFPFMSRRLSRYINSHSMIFGSSWAISCKKRTCVTQYLPYKCKFYYNITYNLIKIKITTINPKSFN